jgi:hypothetical protein
MRICLRTEVLVQRSKGALAEALGLFCLGAFHPDSDDSEFVGQHRRLNERVLREKQTDYDT